MQLLNSQFSFPTSHKPLLNYYLVRVKLGHRDTFFNKLNLRLMLTFKTHKIQPSQNGDGKKSNSLLAGKYWTVSSQVEFIYQPSVFLFSVIIAVHLNLIQTHSVFVTILVHMESFSSCAHHIHLNFCYFQQTLPPHLWFATIRDTSVDTQASA